MLKSLSNLLGGGGGNGLSAVEAEAQLKGDTPPFVLDVRSPDEFRMGHISGAHLIPLDALRQRQHELPTDRDILCVCRSGARSGMAVQQLKAAGFKAFNLRGGMIDWQQVNLPIQKGK